MNDKKEAFKIIISPPAGFFPPKSSAIEEVWIIFKERISLISSSQSMSTLREITAQLKIALGRISIEKYLQSNTNDGDEKAKSSLQEEYAKLEQEERHKFIQMQIFYINTTYSICDKDCDEMKRLQKRCEKLLTLTLTKKQQAELANTKDFLQNDIKSFTAKDNSDDCICC